MMSSAPSSGPRHVVDADKCRNCGARLRPEATWCSLCHTTVAGVPEAGRWAPLLPADRPLADAVSELRREPSATETAPMQATPEPRPADPELEAAAERLLAELAQDEARRDRQTRLAAFRQWFERLTGLTGAGRELVLAVSGGVVLLAGLILGLTLLGLLL